MASTLAQSLAAATALLCAVPAAAQPLEAKLDRMVAEGMQRTNSQGLAIAVIDKGQVKLVKSWGKRNAKGEPLTTDTVMYGASLTKAMFGYLVAQLAHEGKLDLDASIATKLLQEYADEANYAPYEHLAAMRDGAS